MMLGDHVAVGLDRFLEDDFRGMEESRKAGTPQFAELFLFAAFGQQDELAGGVEPGKRFEHAGHQLNWVMKNPVLLLLNPRSEVGSAECSHDLVQRPAEAHTAIADDLDVALLGLP